MFEWMGGRVESSEYNLQKSGFPVGTEWDDLPNSIEDLPDPDNDRSLEALIADEYSVDPKNVLITSGATHGNFLAAATALRAGDEILVESPGYEPLTATPRALGATIRRFERSGDDQYAIDPERIATAATDDTALVTVTERHNPSGQRVGRSVLSDAATAAKEQGARLLVDEVYSPYAAAPTAETGFGGSTAAGIENAVVTNSLSKFFGLGWLRLGWMIADEAFLEQVHVIVRHLPTVSRPSKREAARVVDNAEMLTRPTRERIETNAGQLADFVADRNDLFGIVDSGCTLAFLGHERADGDTVAAAAEEVGVLVIPGRFFGEPERFRISVARNPDTVAAALNAFGDALDSL